MLCQPTYKRFVSIILLVVVQLSLFASCGGSSVSVTPKPTDELVVYVPPEYFISRAMKVAKERFEARFPEVNLTFRTFGGENSAPAFVKEAELDYRTLLQAELTAGKGPDLIIFDENTFPDSNKALLSGNFYDLDAFLLNDDSFDASVYQETIFNAGYCNGQRLFVPLDYVNYALVSTEATMQSFGISMPSDLSFEDWAAQITTYIESHTLEENRKLFYSYDELYSRLFLKSCGLSVLNYETQTVEVQTEEFQNYMQFYKTIYPYLILDWEGSTPEIYSTNGNFLRAILSDNLLFYVDQAYQADMNYNVWLIQFYNSACVPKMAPLPVLEGKKPYAWAGNRAAINNSSPNKANAYEFLKILLSDAQSELFIPVHNPTLQLNHIGYKSYGFTQEEVNAMYDYLQNLEYQEPIPEAVIDIIYNTMQPWVDDLKAYDPCLIELQNALEIYINE